MSLSPRSLRDGIKASLVANVLSRVLGLVRQMLVAGYFGVSFAMDVYFMVLALIQMIVFTATAAFEQAALPHLVTAREQDGDEAFSVLAGRLFFWSWVVGGFMAVATLTLFPPLAVRIADGFSDVKKKELVEMSWRFAPWVLLCAPASCANVILRGRSLYDWVVINELGSAVVSVAGILLWHSSPHSLPGIMAGAAATGVVLFVMVGSRFMKFKGKAPRIALLLKQSGKLIVAQKVSLISSVADRFIQSHLPSGSISGLSYAQTIMMTITDIILFREFYMVPLTAREGRGVRLERLVAGFLLVSIPVAGFVGFNAMDIVRVFLEHGKFSAEANAFTAAPLAVQSVCLVLVPLGSPLVRLLSVDGRFRVLALLYAISSAALVVVASLGVFVWKGGGVGYSWGVVAGSAALLISAVLVTPAAREVIASVSVRLAFRHALLGALVALGATFLCPRGLSPLLTVACRGGVFVLGVIAVYSFQNRLLFHWVWRGKERGSIQS